MALVINPNSLTVGFNRWTTKLTLSGGSWSGSWPLNNSLVEPLRLVARSTDTSNASTQFTAQLDVARPVRLVGFVAHNARPFDQFRVVMWADAAKTIMLKDSGLQYFWPPIVAYGTVPYGDAHWYGGRPTAEDIAGFNPTRVWDFGAGIQNTKAIDVYIFTTAANPDGCFKLGMFEVSMGWQFKINLAYGLQYGIKSRSVATQAYGGQVSVTQLPSQREWLGASNEMPHNEAMSQGLRMLKQYDIAVPFLWCLDPQDGPNLMYNTALVKRVELTLGLRSFFENDQHPIHALEVL